MTKPHVSNQNPPMKFYMVQIGKTFKVYKTLGTARGQITRHLNNRWPTEKLPCFLWETSEFEWQAFSETEACSVCNEPNHSKEWKHAID